MKKWFRSWFLASVLAVLLKKQPVMQDADPTMVLVYEKELGSLKDFLATVLSEEVLYTFENAGCVRVHTMNETIAYVKIFAKGGLRSQMYILIELQDYYRDLQIWFSLAFLGFKVNFKKPVLMLRHTPTAIPRGQ